MNYQTRQVCITLGSDIGYHDKDDQAVWALINDALRRGEDVTARITAVNTALDQRTLVHRGEDGRGLPVFGVGPATKIQLRLQMTVGVSVPTPDEREQAGPKEPSLAVGGTVADAAI